ncbi:MULTISPECIES: biotin--[acetyl-CoA-carboxylase] ligase [Cohnella]|uniref:biotin--[acetyl-CoA-carboxylase] ligase n=1 Tax=Cohnella TaxID=329857 RepID=UPI0009BC26E0|nr:MULTISPECIES: biotin--[acetyl-CoA-carboxylase] ligase [Cohnella]MBN2984275.1 biotin--[acetyl-CoA-carboxylase] ligase [Cohnella algarum]
MKPTSLLALLESAEPNAYVSGEEISRRLGVSRTAVWKQVRKLEAEGFRIEAVPRLGYRLAGRPERLSQAELAGRMKTRSFGRVLHLLESVHSTQDVMRKLAEEGAPEGTLVIAEQQTAGRGRMGRSWVSPAGKGIWMSLLLRPRLPMQATPQLTLLAAVALSRAISAVVPLSIGIKWPNDLLVDGRKISGILLESATEDERVRYIVVGIGVSVNLEREDYPEEVAGKAVSLKMAAGRPVDRAELIACTLQEFENLYELYLQEGFEPIRALWEARSVNLNRPAVLHTPKGVIEGVPRGLSDMGGLRVELPDGSIETVYSAEINPWREG